MTHKRCDHELCSAVGEYRAPKSREPHGGYFYFCIEHIRVYNQQWDYFKGMSPDEIMAHRISDITWRRPTFTLRDKRISYAHVTEHPFFETPIGIIRPHPINGAFPIPHRNSSEYKAIQVLGLEYPFSMDRLKKNYLKLVKNYHPDTNAGCKKSEEALKKIISAYKVLVSYVSRYS